mgnify:CR=1 FL=1
MRTAATGRWIKDDRSRAYSRYNTQNDDSTSKIELQRANSPTLKRLVAARVKLDKYANYLSRTTATSRLAALSQRETPYLKNPIKETNIVLKQSEPDPRPSSSKSKPDQPLDKITYQKTWSINGNITQKCSLEIWLPKPSLDDDDDSTSNSTRTEKIDSNQNDKRSQSAKSRRSSVTKVSKTPTVNFEPKSNDEVVSKKSEPVLIPRVYHYGDYIMDLPEERPRSSKSVTTVKSDSVNSVKSIRRQQIRSANRRSSGTTHHSEEILLFKTFEVSKPTKTTNPTMINELMQKYSVLKKDHQELTQTKLQLEKPINELKSSPKDPSPRTRPPPIPDSTALIPSDSTGISVKKILIETSTRPLTEQTTHTNSKLLERRATPRQPSNLQIYPHLRIFSLANQRQQRQTTDIVPASLLPSVTGRKTDDFTRTLQRSKTLDVVLDIPNAPTSTSSPSVKSRRTDSSHRRSNKQQSSAQTVHRSSTTIPTNTVLIRFNHTNTERNYLVPE